MKHQGNLGPQGVKPSGYNMQECVWLQHWCRAETSLSFISHHLSQVWSGNTEHKMGEIERETTVILVLMHSTRDLMVLSTQALYLEVAARYMYHHTVILVDEKCSYNQRRLLFKGGSYSLQRTNLHCTVHVQCTSIFWSSFSFRSV